MDETAKYEKRIRESSASLIYADGKPYDCAYARHEEDREPVLHFDPCEHFRTVDRFAVEYGLGGCRSFTEFSNMIDQEDPVIIEGLLYAMKMRYDEEAEPVNDKSTSGIPQNNGSSTFRNKWGHDSDMTDFLLNSGMDPQAVKDAKARLKDRKISNKEEQDYYEWLYSAVTPETIRDPKFNLKEVLARISEHDKNSEKFIISASTIFQGPKK